MSVDNRYTEETILKKRKFPKAYTVFLVILIIIQIALVVGGIFYKASPKDRIDSYEVYVTPQGDGTLDLLYKIKWTALDSSEPLTWIEIGMANPNFAIYGGYSSNIDRIVRTNNNDGYTSVKIYLKDSYIGGESFEIQFEINQRNMLCDSNGTRFYEFVPCWFNEIPVTSYAFYWKDADTIVATNADDFDGTYHKWTGSFNPGEYRKMHITYSRFAAPTTYYYPFDDSGAFDGLAEDKYATWALIAVFLIITVVAEVYIIDAFISYNRGRGFLTGYGHHVHTYGYRNPRYISASRAHASSSGGRGGRGGGCACACACACAGGGRAGCSQKDTTEIKKDK
ncbi:MAG: hypothetical protein IJV68_03290 [Clostridia bacterium]|nr:hypothetical protein [Clostridia bacterium]MBQ9703549.1 hypothetical protein [Clostridia bacterium]